MDLDKYRDLYGESNVPEVEEVSALSLRKDVKLVGKEVIQISTGGVLCIIPDDVEVTCDIENHLFHMLFELKRGNHVRRRI